MERQVGSPLWQKMFNGNFPLYQARLLSTVSWDDLYNLRHHSWELIKIRISSWRYISYIFFRVHNPCFQTYVCISRSFYRPCWCAPLRVIWGYALTENYSKKFNHIWHFRHIPSLSPLKFLILVKGTRLVFLGSKGNSLLIHQSYTFNRTACNLYEIVSGNHLHTMY